MTTSPTTSPAPMRAGGRATEAGMAFQGAVATWFAAHILARSALGGRFGINNLALPVGIRLETGEALDDIEVTMSDGGVIHIQCKTSANLGTGTKAPLTKTIGQLARWVADAKVAGSVPDPTSTAAVLAVRSDAAQSLDNLEGGCRAFDMGGAWTITHGQRNAAQRGALDAFKSISTAAWTAHRGIAPVDDDLVDMARLFGIARFAMDEGDADWREASGLLGRHLFAGNDEGDAALRDLRGIMRDLTGSGAPADRAGLLRALHQRGHRDVGAPGFEADIARLRAATSGEMARLAIHGRLPLGSGLPITRESDTPLRSAIEGDSLLVIGEPGAGKTGALVHAITALSASGNDIVFLSVDRFPGVAIAADLASELGLTRSVVETLAAWPGATRKILVIDALDAARGGPSEAVFAALIEAVRDQLPALWSVVASIRTFDLKNGRRFSRAFAGIPANANYADPALPAVRHFLIPRLTEADLARAGEASEPLRTLLASAPMRLIELLRNVFNLSLAAQLLDDGTAPAAFGSIGSQSGLIDAYEDARLSTSPLQQAAAATAALMASRRRLSVRKVAVEHSELDAVIRTGVLLESGDLVSFAHHVLFDHVAGRFHLEWDDPQALLAQLAGDTSAALLLAPALRFAVERLWRSDRAGRPLVWKLAVDIFSAATVDPVLGNVALRTAAERVENESDIGELLVSVNATPTAPELAAVLSRLAQFAAIEMKATPTVAVGAAIAWARLAEVLTTAGERALLQPAHDLLHALFERSELDDQNLAGVFGRASRALLTLAWAATPPLPTSSPIRFVGKSFASDPAASRTLLDRVLREPHFSLYADQEAGWLAEQILPITRADPEFTVEIYAALYGQTISDQATTFLGGQRSRIMPLLGNRRQDFEHCRWRLGVAVGEVLAITPEHGTRALIDAVIGRVTTRGYGPGRDAENINLAGVEIELRGRDYEIEAWDAEPTDRRNRDDDLLRHFVTFLRDCTPQAYAAIVLAASRGYATASIWLRIFGVGRERIANVADFLWPLIERIDFLEHGGISRDAFRFVAAAWPTRTREERVRIETMVLDESRFSNQEEIQRWHRRLRHLFSALPEASFELEPTRALWRTLNNEAHLRGNDSADLSATYRRDTPDFVRDELRRNGIDVEAGPTAALLVASDALHAQVQRTTPTSTANDLAGLWQAAAAQIELIDASPGLGEQAGVSVWGLISNAVERVSSSENYLPGSDGLPSLDEMTTVLRRLSASPYPLWREGQSSDSWGNWDVRVYAADAWISLAPRFAAERPEIVDHIEAILQDPVGAVRLQASRNLQVISVIAPDRMWAMAERLVTLETETTVMASYLNNSMYRFGFTAPERCEAVLEIVKQRLRDGFSDSQDHLKQSLGGWAAQLFAAQGRPIAREWLAEWAADPERYWQMLDAFASNLRGAFFYRYARDAEPSSCAMCDRSQEGLALMLSSALTFSGEAHAVLVSDAIDADKQAASSRYQAAERVIINAMNQLYFGSGTFGTDDEGGTGLPDTAAKTRFLVDYAEILALLAGSHEPAALHHLVDLYEFLIPGDPVAVFEAVHGVLLGRGREEGYQYESLGNTSVIRVVQRYIADQRAIFEDAGRRARLVEILQLFSGGGWPEALRLLYDLPDLLR